MKGFTLIELMIVVAIVGILLAITAGSCSDSAGACKVYQQRIDTFVICDNNPSCTLTLSEYKQYRNDKQKVENCHD